MKSSTKIVLSLFIGITAIRADAQTAPATTTTQHASSNAPALKNQPGQTSTEVKSQSTQSSKPATGEANQKGTSNPKGSNISSKISASKTKHPHAARLTVDEKHLNNKPKISYSTNKESQKVHRMKKAKTATASASKPLKSESASTPAANKNLRAGTNTEKQVSGNSAQHTKTPAKPAINSNSKAVVIPGGANQ